MDASAPKFAEALLQSFVGGMTFLQANCQKLAHVFEPRTWEHLTKADREQLVCAANEYLRSTYKIVENKEDFPRNCIFMYDHNVKSQIKLNKAWQIMLGSRTLRTVLRGFRDRRAGLDAVPSEATASPASMILSDFLPASARALHTHRAVEFQVSHRGSEAASVAPAPRQAKLVFSAPHVSPELPPQRRVATLAPWARAATGAVRLAALPAVQKVTDFADVAAFASASKHHDESSFAWDGGSTCSTATNHSFDRRRSESEEWDFSAKIGKSLVHDTEVFGIARANLTKHEVAVGQDMVSPSSVGHLTSAAECVCEALASGPPVPAELSAADARGDAPAAFSADAAGRAAPSEFTAMISKARPMGGCESARAVQEDEESLVNQLEKAVPGLGLAASEARVLHFPGSRGCIKRMLEWIEDNEVALLSELVDHADSLVKIAGFKDIAGIRLKKALRDASSKA